MSRFRRISASVSVLALGTANAALADVTAQEVWDSWKDQLAIYGADGVSFGAEEMSGDTLTVSDVTLSMMDDEASVTAALGDIIFTEQGDGSVVITMTESYPITIEATSEFGPDTTVLLTVSNSNMSLSVSGTEDDMAYALAADQYAITLDEVREEGLDPVDINAATVALNNVAGTYTLRTDDLSYIDYAMTIAELTVDVDVTDDPNDVAVVMSGSIADLQAAARAVLPAGFSADVDELSEAEQQAFVEAFDLTGGYSFGATTYSVDINEAGTQGTGAASVEGGQLAVSFDKDALSYTSATRGIALNFFSPAEIPFPVEVSVGEYGFDLLAPLSQGDAPRDMRMAFNMTDLAISDGIWNLFDPGEVLERGPATLRLAIDGKVTPFFDFLDPTQTEAIAMSAVPGELNEITLSDLRIAVAGADLSGDGSFTFDNQDMQTFDGFPRPEGVLNMTINGVNGLVDNLIQMGLIPEEDAMMPRLMLGMIATPVGDDMLTSTIEVNSEGHVLANGQRLR